MTEQQTLVEFLTERLDEEGEAAKLVRQPYRLYIDGEGVISEPLTIESPWDDRQGEYEQWSDGEDRLPNRHTYWTLLYDPARVLREVAAKRAIIADHQIKAPYEIERGDEEFGCECCYSDELGVLGFGYCPTLKALAAVYSDHEAYREEWRP